MFRMCSHYLRSERLGPSTPSHGDFTAQDSFISPTALSNPVARAKTHPLLVLICNRKSEKCVPLKEITFKKKRVANPTEV